jgi:sulfate adenylyltransferase subunit 1
MDLLRISTAGSVDDGKSTLIGRLLFETGSLTEDRVAAIKEASWKKGVDFLDFSLATDGLIAEREQGITIDVAYIHFATDKRKFIIADTPGHKEYTRNMVTGSSTADVSIILADVTRGLTEQSFRHFFIAEKLRIPNVIVCVNKMDLREYSQTAFEEVRIQAEKLIARSSFKAMNVSIIPVSALKGDNVISTSSNMPWYSGAPLLQLLEEVKALSPKDGAFRFHIQDTLRSGAGAEDLSRYYAGKVNSGTVKVGDEILTWPGQRRSKVSAILRGLNYADEASAGESVAISIEDDIDLSRGSVLSSADNVPLELNTFESGICWMDRNKVQAGSRYLLQFGTSRVPARIEKLEEKWDPVSGEALALPDAFELNDIGRVRIKLAKPVYADSYETLRNNGAFILIDEQTFNTSAVGFIEA